MSDNYYFCSISQFVNRINKNHEHVSMSTLYFEGKDCFKNKYDRICCKPIFIDLMIEDKHTYIPHKEIYKMFDGQQLVISFNENNKRKMNEKNKNCLYKLTIYFEAKDFNGNTYFNSNLKTVTNEANCIKIRKQVIVYEEEEIEIPDFAFPS